MNTEIVKAQKVIVMKSGMSIFIEAERAAVAEGILASGSGHRFLQIDDQTINSAEIEGIYGPEQYDEIQRVKRGEYKCRWGKWHMRREECSCGKEAGERIERYKRMKKRIAEGKFDDEFQEKSMKGYLAKDEVWLKERKLI